MDNKGSREVDNFKKFSCEISQENEKKIQHKLVKFAQILGILNKTFKIKFLPEISGIKENNNLALPVLLYGSEI